jgi:hypothetical protein
MSDPFPRHPVRQIAFFVADVVAAARRHSAIFGSGPFYVAEHIPPLSASIGVAPRNSLILPPRAIGASDFP